MKWSEVTIAQYKMLPSVLELPEGIERNIKIMSVLTGIDEDTYFDMPLPQLQQALKDCELTNVNKEASIKSKYFVNGKEYILTAGAARMTAGQYIDYTNTLPATIDNYHILMAMLLVPKGHTYGKGYSVPELAKELEQHFKWVDVVAISFFFQNLLTSYTKATLSYLRRKLKRMNRQESDPSRIEIVQKAIDDLATVGHGLGSTSKSRRLQA